VELSQKFFSSVHFTLLGVLSDDGVIVLDLRLKVVDEHLSGR